MPQIELVSQAIGPDTHASTIQKLLTLPNLKQFVASVAFVRQDGVDSIAEALKRHAKACEFYIGIRNEITSVQAVHRLLEIGVSVHAVDTASRAILFHPKLFIAISETEALVLIGSANVTFSGLHNNFETSSLIRLRRGADEDDSFIRNCLNTIGELRGRFPRHVVRVKSRSAANKLLAQGRLEDETITIARPPRKVGRKGMRDDLEPILIPKFTAPSRRKRITLPPMTPIPVAGGKPIRKSGVTLANLLQDYVLIWQSKELKERDLNIPTGTGTHATGSMLWKKGTAEDIDQRHFFRDEVFADLDWVQDPKKKHYERAEAKFTIVIKNLCEGTYNLKLSHNTNTESATYKQSNAMTSVSWGKASTVIGRRDLLKRTMSLYKNCKNPPEFLLEID